MGLIVNRHCTGKYKIQPVNKKIRQLTGCNFKNPVTVWIAFSLDEIQRVKPSQVKYVINSFPLIENRIDREGCVEYMTDNGFEVPVKSACIGCPFHDDELWSDLDESEFQDAVNFERELHKPDFHTRKEDSNKFFSQCYLHEEGEDIEARPFEKAGRMNRNLQNEECTGGCFL